MNEFCFSILPADNILDNFAFIFYDDLSTINGHILNGIRLNDIVSSIQSIHGLSFTFVASHFILCINSYSHYLLY